MGKGVRAISGYRCFRKIALTPFSDGCLSRGVEEMRALGLEREPQPLVRARAHARIDTRDDRALAHARVEQDLGAERLHHLDGGIESVVARCASARPAQRLGTQAEDHALAAVAA